MSQTKAQKRQAAKAAKAERQVLRRTNKAARKAAQQAAKTARVAARQAAKNPVANTLPSNVYPINTGYTPTQPVNQPAQPVSQPIAPMVYPSGYNPNAVLADEFKAPDIYDPYYDPTVGYSSVVGIVDNSLPIVIRDDAMRAKLLHIKNTNPDYYTFIADRLTSSLNGMGEAYNPWGGALSTTPTVWTSGSTTTAAPTEKDWVDKIFDLGKQYADVQLEKLKLKLQTGEETQNKIAQMQASNQYLATGTDNTKLYIFGGLSLLAVAYLIFRSNRKK